MNRGILLFGLLLVFAVSCGEAGTVIVTDEHAVTMAPTVVMPTVEEPQTKVDTLKMGRLIEGEVVEKSLWLKNNSQKPLVIVSTVTGCGCTSVKYDTRPIHTGDSTLFTIRFDSKDRFGSQIKDIALIDADNQVARAIVTVEVVD